MRPAALPRTGLSALLLGLAALTGGAAHAAIYRCGQTYQDTPCPGAKVVDGGPQPTEEQVQDAQTRAAAQSQWVQGMRRERQQLERSRAEEERLRKAQQAAAAAPAATTTTVYQPVGVFRCPSGHRPRADGSCPTVGVRAVSPPKPTRKPQPEDSAQQPLPSTTRPAQ